MSKVRTQAQHRAPFLHRKLKEVSCLTLIGLGIAALMPAPAAAQQIESSSAGSEVVNPSTGETERILVTLGDSALTDGNRIILLRTSVGEAITDPDDVTQTATIASVVRNTVTDQIEQVVLEDGRTLPVVRDVGADLRIDPTLPNVPSLLGRGPLSAPTGNIARVNSPRTGSTGSAGDPLRARIGIPPWIAPTNGGTGTAVSRAPITVGGTRQATSGIGVSYTTLSGNGGTGGNLTFSITGGSAGNGGAGGTGGTLNITIDESAGITTSAAGGHGLRVRSEGGNGGRGGNAFALIDANGGTGGRGGNGGTATATNRGNITTRGTAAIGILSQSFGGQAGSGGTGGAIIVGIPGGADGGGSGGTATANNEGTLHTFGAGAHGVLAQSIGGNGGSSGTAGAIVAIGGAASSGGNGGTATASTSVNGLTVTRGNNAIGVMAQSIGGGGGSGGAGGGIVTVGSEAAAGGNGGTARVIARSNGVTYTTGIASHGMLAQSIGGGGGHGGAGGGVVTVGSKGSGGGNGSTAEADTFADSLIYTQGQFASGIVVQSIGGGGGASGPSGGLVAVGGSSSTGGRGASALVDTFGDIVTKGTDARGIIAQSVGGGGGIGSPSGGLVAIGGRGGGGGSSGTVTVNQGGRLFTSGFGADGVLAQSIGGGGGASGASGGAVSVGGSGTGGGGTAGTVNITNTGLIFTGGDIARGLIAQSIGGGGGAGGHNGGLVSVGGSASSAGNGGRVNLTNRGDIVTEGDFSIGMMGQSIGGGGGDGGTAGGVFFTLGGRGGGGGTSNTVTITNARNLLTSGDFAHGILAQSVGGGGGNGGGSASLSAFLGVGIGGSGGSGGAGRTVDLNFQSFNTALEGNTITLDPIIETRGNLASGFVAQSVGGGGGNGGFAVQATAGAFGAVSVGVGGRGGSGGNGGTVDIDGDVTIITRGIASTGMTAQSVGGGGGNGGFVVSAAAAGGPAAGSVSVGVGGRGGSGSTGGTVDIDSGGLIITEGILSTGLVAQSVGGGGGNGGFNVNLAGAGGVAGSASVAVGVGGSGGGGGNGGSVFTDYTGNVVTEGDLASGVVTQSVGGGGGNGGFNVTANVSASPGVAGGTAVGVGGGGGRASAGGIARTNFTGDITTLGDLSDAILVQSLGGGGGNGGFNVSGSINGSAGGAVGVAVGVGGSAGGGGSGVEATLNLDGAIATEGFDADGVIVQSLGGGGGNGGLNVSGTLTGTTAGGGISVGVGGTGGSAGAGGVVNATADGSIFTMGDDSTAFLAQSLGGGGGNGGVNVAGAVGITSAGGGNLSVGVGGAGGPGGSASKVTATVNSTVLTEGNNSDGIIAQSLGGGGGNGGVNVAGNLTFSGAAGAGISVGVGGAGGGAGSGGEVDLTVGADLMTMGDGSAGILAQSLGGSGGNGAVNVAGGITGSSSAGGSINVGVGGVGGSGGGANTVTASVSGNVTTFGSQANAITAQSLGGGGGNGGVNVTAGVTLTGASGGTVGVGVGGAGGAGGTGGAVDFTLDGSARAAGESSNAVTVQSLGGGGGNGGVNVSGGLTFAGGTAGTVSVGVGGRGGTGNIARNVDVDITGDITAEDGSALVAQSIGGGGGNGGLNIAGGINVARGASLAVGVGGFGGSGGNAGAVTVDTREGSLTSEGDFKSAAFIQSLGGGGGDGGINISGGIASDSAIAVGIGGSGDAGGSGGNVTATLASDLSARGIFASGLLAQSIGGGGGRGGVNISGTLSGFTNAKAPSLAFGLGGTGGLGSQAGDVTVDYLGTTAVDGFLSTGLVAQSVGGGGGQGGLNVAANLTAAQRNTVGGSFGIGGSGGSGGDGGIVSMDTDGTIMVNMNPDDDSQLPSVFGIGVMAQSVGGGGGNGGANFAGVASAGATPISVALGGSGAGGGIGGAVTMRNGLEAEDSLIAVGGPGGFGLLAQSIGGGGGNGGFNFNANVAPNRETRATADVRIGGSGGDGGTSGEVNVTNAGRIVTIEGATIGLAAQSIAGGGGNSSTNFGLDLINPSDQAKTVNLNFSLGGVAGNGGMAGNVIVDHSGRIDTNGKDSTGLLAQSIAGGGGSIGGSYDYGIGGDSSLAVALGRQGGTGGMAGTIDVTSSGIITTLGDGAYGLLAQSIAGGGGNSSTTSITASTETGENDGAVAWNGEYSQGHEGGSGGTANTVTVRHSGTISTEGRDASGVLAQSIGGGGGAGGSALIDLVQQILSLPTGGTDSFGVSVQRGGVGGTGGTGGFVDVANTGSVFTLGDRSHGVNAMSIGGGGGEGGSVTNIALAGRGTNFQGEVGLGGAGGTGGAGGDVLAFNTGMIQTTGEASHGLRGQSVGGGGGDAGLVATFTGAFSGSEDQTVSVTANIGATGGSGNSGGNVDVLNGAEDDFENAMILTTGDRSHGIFAQSVGGGGGAGSTVLNFSAASGAGGDGSAAFALNMGGDGGVGGLGGLVSVTNRGLIETQGDEAHGIFAQSVGGGGGNGGLSLAGAIVPSNPLGLNTLLVSLGGSGGEGGDGAAVTVNNFGSILTRGRSAHGIFAQSVGGGGGNASIALSGTNSQEGIILSNGLSAIIGAATVRPGEGGTGGTVTVNSSGNITVLGEDSEAVVAQTVNGGGGGFAFDVRGIATDILGVGFDLDDLLDRPVFEIGAGAQDVFGAESDKVTVNITGTVQAAGARSVGESLQSVGGGGGRSAARLELTADEGDIDAFDVNLFLGSRGGGMNRGGDIESVRAGDLILEGAGSTGLFAQSVGGGGGRSSFAATYDAGVFGDVNLRLGSIGSEENAGGNITLTRAGNVSVAGVGAYGGIVQSVGGGGGSFNLDFEQAEANAAENGSPILLAVSVSEPDAPTRQQAAAGSYTSLFAETELSGPALAGNHTVQLGADGGTSLDGGDISLQFNGDTLTTHDQSTGYLIQSIGGGGGDMRIAGLEGLDVTVGGSNGASGNGGDVSFALNGTIETLGVGSHGLVLQAIGGGGGTVLAGGAATVTTLSAANTGDGGSVALAVDGNVVTRGDGSTAILAQSLGGGGGLVDGVSTGSAGGSGAGDAISLKINGTVAALGEGSTAVYAESDGTTGAGAISVSISEGGSVMAGTGGQAIVFVGGSGNSLSNDGMIATDDMLDGLAITAGSGDDAIVNRGTIIGSVSLGGGDNSFMNVEGGEIFSSQAVDLGAGSGLLTNSGLLDPGGVANTMTTSLTGSFSQTATGLSLIDIDLADRTYDAVNASGTIELNGEVDVTLLNRYQLTPGRLDAAVFTGEGGVTLGDANLTADSTVVLDLKGLTATPNAVNVSYDISFAPEELAGNQVAVGEYLNDIRAAGTDASLDPLWVTLIDETDIDTYADWMSQMGPELYAEQQVLAIEAGEVLAGDMRSCGAASLGAQVSDERLCAWVKGSVGTSERDAADGIAETSNDRQAFTAGAHYALGDIWSIGGGIAYQSDEVTGFGDRWQSDGETLSVALGIRRDAEKLGLGATLVATNATFDSRRAVSVLETAEAVSDRDVTAVSGMIDASYALQYGQLSVVPNAALGVTNLSADGVTETGAGLLNLDVVSSDETVSWLEPGVRVSWDGGGDGAGFMPFADLSVRQVLSGEVTSASARLAAAMSPSDSLMVADSDFGATRLRGEAGLQYGFGNGARLALAYKIEQSDNRNADSAQLRLAMPF